MTTVVTDPTPPTRLDVGAIRAIVARDLRAIRRSKAVVLPMMLVPFLLMIVLPLVVGYAARQAAIPAGKSTYSRAFRRSWPNRSRRCRPRSSC